MVTLTLSLLSLSAFFLAGCFTIGPWTVTRDRFDYSAAISESWKRQTLLNLIKIRYADAPVFLDVTSIINQYALDSQLGLRLSWLSLPPGDGQAVTGAGRYSERPTITYTPLMGAKFTRSMMTPIPPSALFSLIQANWPVDFLFRLCVQAVNGVYNRTVAQMKAHAGDLEFYALLEAFQRIQQSGAMGLRVGGNKGETLIVFRRHKDLQTEADHLLVREKLGLNPEATEFQLTFGALAQNDREIAVLTRSMLEVLVELSMNIDVPVAHIQEQRVALPLDDETTPEPYSRPLLRVSSGSSRPSDAFVAVPYHGYWFWIDDQDFPSKRMFSFIMMLFTLVEPVTKEEGPAITVPTGP